MVSAPKTKKDELLYCAFCGKTQHEVKNLIAGPTVYICDECVDLCYDIVVEEGAKKSAGTKVDKFVRYTLAVRFDRPFAPEETTLIPAIIQTIEAAYPGCRISISSFVTRGEAEGGSLLLLHFDSPVLISESKISKLENEIEDLARQLKIAQERYLVEKAERERFEVEYKQLVEDVFPIIVTELRKQGRIGALNTKTLLILFADIVGFSKFSAEERSQKLDLMRLIGRSVLKSEKGIYTNTWGDGVVAAFDDPTQGLRCACKFVTHLHVDGIEARVGVSWGAARIRFNDITQRLDVDGESVNFGARLEPLAEPGEVLASDVVCALDNLDKGDFLFTAKEVELKKDVGEKKAGDKLRVYGVKYYPNK